MGWSNMAGEDRAADAADDLCHSEQERGSPCDFTPEREYAAHSGVEVRSGDRPQRRDEDVEDGASRYRVGEQRDCGVPVCQRLRHDA
jgi:hypothetical protein